jgi:nucleoside-diphosphate kinase
MGNKTFAIIKPDAVKNEFTGKIYDRIQKAGFNILAAKLLKMTTEQADGFYNIHKDKPFFNELIDFMTSGPCMVLALEKENAVLAWRDTIGATNPEDALENTIRKDFATSVQENAVHGSDSDENAEKEIAFFFADSELLGK